MHASWHRACVVGVADPPLFCLQGPNGLSLAMSDQAIVVGFHSENITPANCRMTVEGIKDYLKGVGY